MKRFPHIISKLFYEPLILTPQKHGALCQVVEAHMDGKLTAQAEEMPADVENDAVKIGGTMIIPVYGVIDQHIPDSPSGGEGCDVGELSDMIDNARADASVNRIVFDFRSPGGSVTGVPELARKIASILPEEKETVAWTDSECCSGALWLAAQCQKFYSTPSASIGSVGVWCAYMDASRAMENSGQTMQSFSAGKYKLLGAYWKPMSDEERTIVQKSVDKIYSNFKSAMQTYRSVSDESCGNGLCFDGEESADIGFTDGTMESLDELLEQLDSNGE